MNIVSDRTYSDQEVIVDYTDFRECHFENCTGNGRA